MSHRAGAPGRLTSRRPTRCAIAVGLLLVFVSLLLPPAVVGQSAPPQFDLKDPVIVDAGRILFNQRCAGRCHGIDGREGFEGPGLVGKVYLDRTYGWVTLITGRAGSAMPSWSGRLTDDELWKLVAFMSWLGDQARKTSR